MREKSPILNRPLRVMHIISGDLWAGAESQAFTLLKHLNSSTTLHVVIMNDGELAHRLRQLHLPITLIPESTLNSLKLLSLTAQSVVLSTQGIRHELLTQDLRLKASRLGG